MAAFVEGSVYRVRGEAVVEVGGARSLLNNCRVGFFSTTPNDLNSDSNDGNGAYKEPGWKPSVADARWIGPLSTIDTSLTASLCRHRECYRPRGWFNWRPYDEHNCSASEAHHARDPFSVRRWHAVRFCLGVLMR